MFQIISRQSAHSVGKSLELTASRACQRVQASSIQNRTMHRPRNRNNRNADQTRTRGSGIHRNSPRPTGPSVPRYSAVVPGASVSIVLKVDQATGKEVQGFVSEVLTRGDHPRGIKVRLTDGRVGRVQRLTSEAEANAGSEGLNGLGRNGESSSQNDPMRGGPSGRRGMSTSTTRFTHRYHDMRADEDGQEAPAKGYSLDDLLPEGHPLKAPLEDTTVQEPATNAHGPTQTCPVCGQFEGDEYAVSRHVDSHFE